MVKKNRHQRSESVAVKPQQIRAWHRSWFPPALYCLLSLAYFGELPFSDKVIFGYDAGTDYHRGNEPFLEKLGDFIQPAWSPDFGGRVLSDEMRFQFFPSQLVYLFSSFHRHLGWRYVIMMWAAGWGMFHYMRVLGVNRSPALWVGVAYMSAPVFLGFTWAGHFAKMGVICLFPLSCWALEKGMDSGRLYHFTVLAGLIAAGIYSPHIQMLYYALCALGLNFLFRIYVFYRKDVGQGFLLKRGLLFALAISLGLGTGAVGVFPAYLFAKNESKRAIEKSTERAKEDQLAFARSWSLHPEEIAALVVPEFGGFRIGRDGENYYWGRNAFKDNSEYFGILVVLLALVAAGAWRSDTQIVFFCLLFLLVGAFTLGGHTPVHWLVYHLLPGAQVLRSIGMAAYLFAFAGCALAGLGLQRILEPREDEREDLRRRTLIIGWGLTGIALMIALAPRLVTDAWIWTVYADILPHKRQVLATGYDWLSRGAYLTALVSAVGTTLLSMAVRRRMSSGVMLLALASLSIVDCWRISRLFLEYRDPSIELDKKLQNPRVVRFLNQDDGKFRVLRLPNHQLYQQLRSGHFEGAIHVNGHFDLTLQRYDRVLRMLGDQGLTGLLTAQLRGENIGYPLAELMAVFHPLLDLVGAKYIVVPDKIPLDIDTDRFPLALSADGFRLYRNPTALPWCYLAPTATQVGDAEQALSMLHRAAVDPRRRVLLEAVPPVGLQERTDLDPEDRATMIDYDADRGYVRIETQSSGSRLLVYCENFHHHWRAVVDGEPTQMYRANYLWRAVYVPAGKHVVEFYYRSERSLTFGAVSLVSLGLTLALGLWDYRRERRWNASTGRE